MTTDADRTYNRHVLWRLAQRLSSDAKRETIIGLASAREHEAAAVRWAIDETGPKAAPAKTGNQREPKP